MSGTGNIPATSDEIARTWIEHCKMSPKNPAREELFWAWEAVSEACRNEPEVGWELILTIHAQDQSDSILQNLSAGPLEDLLAKNGPKVIEWIERQARRDPKFARLLGGVWQNEMPDDIWIRVQAVWDRTGWMDSE